MPLNQALILEVKIGYSEIDRVIRDVINIQKSWDRNIKPQDKPGYLATVFDPIELRQVLEQRGSRLLVAYPSGSDSNTERREAIAFLLITPGNYFFSQLRPQDNVELAFDSEKLEHAHYLYQIAVKSSFTNLNIGSELLLRAFQTLQGYIFADYLIEPEKNVMSERFFYKHQFREIGKMTLAGYRDFGSLISRVVGRSL